VPAIAVPYEMDEGSGAAEGDAAIPSLAPQEAAVLSTLWLAAVPEDSAPFETPEQAKAAIEGMVGALPVRARRRKPVPTAA